MAPKILDIMTFVQDPDWLGDKQISPVQRGILKAIYALPLESEEMDAFLEVTEGRRPAPRGYQEATLICGIRSGKTDKLAANCAAYEALTFDQRLLAPGEIGYLPVTAQNLEGARNAWSYIKGKIEVLERKGRTMPDGRPILDAGSTSKKNITGKEIRFSNGVIVTTSPCNKESLRGKTCIAAIGDEFAFWDTSETAHSSDVEIFRAMRGRMATMRGRGKLLKITSPWVEAGVAWEDYQNRKTAKRLFVQAPSWVLNPSISKRFLDEQRDLDPDGFMREYGAQFGKGGGTYLTTYMVEDAMKSDRAEMLEWRQGLEHVGWIDVGFKHDLFAFAIAHREENRVVFDLIMWWQGTKSHPVDPRDVAGEISQILRMYRLDEVSGDQYAAVPMQRFFNDLGVTLKEVPLHPDRSWEMFQMLKLQLRHNNVELPRADMIKQDLMSLVMTRTGNNGTPRVAAPNRAGFHDDISSVIASLILHFAPSNTKLDIADWNKDSNLRRKTELWYPSDQPASSTGADEGTANIESMLDDLDILGQEF